MSDYSFLEGIDVEIPTDPMYVEGTTSSLRVSNLAYWPKCLHFPLPTLVYLFFYYTSIHLTNTHANVIRLLLGVSTLNFVHRLSLGLEGIFFLYNMKRVEEGKFFFIAKKSA